MTKSPNPNDRASFFLLGGCPHLLRFFLDRRVERLDVRRMSPDQLALRVTMYNQVSIDI